ncbi:MAG TPA: hypothetical protein VG759_01360 [Candidatus Angelobacter sp.]|nr:hypothetical protein [Candidatus Angelobacter sp.]
MITVRKPMILTALATFALLSISAWAQNGAGAAGGSNNAAQDGSQQADQNDHVQMREQQRRRQEEFNRRLNFTADQKQQWMLIQRQTAQQIKAARTDDSLNEEQMQEKLRSLHKQNRVQILAMLTPEQQEELKKWWEEQRAAKQQQDAKADPNASNAANTSNASGQNKTVAKEDDFFAGMVQDPEPAPKTAKKH